MLVQVYYFVRTCYVRHIFAFHIFQAPWFAKHPLVVWDGRAEADDCVVLLEDQILKAGQPVQAILVAFCLHWVVDLCYEPRAKRFYTVIEHILGLSVTKPTGGGTGHTVCICKKGGKVIVGVK